MSAFRTIYPEYDYVIMVVTDKPESFTRFEIAFQGRDCAVIYEIPKHASQTQHVIAPALVIIDAVLSHAGRVELCAQLHARSKCPILVLLSEYDSDQVIDVYNAGVNECLLKPVSPAFVVVKALSLLMHQRREASETGWPMYSGI